MDIYSWNWIVDQIQFASSHLSSVKFVEDLLSKYRYQRLSGQHHGLRRAGFMVVQLLVLKPGLVVN